MLNTREGKDRLFKNIRDAYYDSLIYRNKNVKLTEKIVLQK